MTAPNAVDDDEDLIEIEAGDEAPFTQVPTWVALSGISPTARALYWILAMHLNMQRIRENGDRAVWPGKDTLAALLNLAKASGIDRYLDELAGINAIRKITRRQGRMRTRNRYIVYSRIPEGWAGPTTLAEFYDRRKAARDAAAEASSRARPSTRSA
jgi:hypothetical protein